MMSIQTIRLQTLEQIICDVGDQLVEKGLFGELTVTKKWGQRAFLPNRLHVGTTVRIDNVSVDQVGLFVHCHTSLIKEWKKTFPNLRYEGTRAILFTINKPIPEDVVRKCVEDALTYHTRAQ